MLAGVNDSDADADELARLVQSIPCMINLVRGDEHHAFVLFLKHF